jgi:zinc transport system substrate-binding protein
MKFNLFHGLICLGLSISLVNAPAAQDRPVIAVDSYPLAYFAERLSGGGAEIIFAVPEAIDPGLWRPTIADIAAIQGADLVALNGASFADWVTKVSLPRARTVDTSATFADRFIPTETLTHAHGAEGEHSHTGTASYTWLDLSQAAIQADALASAMARATPELAGGLPERLAELKQDLSALDTTARSIGGGEASVITSHPRYQYFARAYGLSAHALDWDASTTPTEDQWATLAALQQETGARILIWEATPSLEVADRATELGLVSVAFPPLASRPVDGDFLASLARSLAALDAALTLAGTAP